MTIDPGDLKIIVLGALNIAADLLGLPVLARAAGVVAALIARGLELLQSNSAEQAVSLLRVRAEKTDLAELRNQLEYEAINGTPKPKAIPRPDDGALWTLNS